MTAHWTPWVIAFVLAANSAAGAVEVSPAKLELRGLRAEPLRATFTVRHAQAEKPQYTPGDLREQTRGTVLLGMQVTSAKESEVNGAVVDRVTVVVPVPPKAGRFTGVISVDAGPAARTTVEVSATFDPVPSVDTDLGSKSAVFRLVSDDGAQVHRSVLLLQTGEGEFKVDGATVSALKRGDVSLPDRAMTLAKDPPIDSTAGSAKVDLVGTGTGAKAGEYDGTLHLRVENQDRRVQVPVKVLIKDDPTIPLIVLVLGVVAAWFLGWWNGDASAAHDVVQAARRLETGILSGDGLQARERQRCMELVLAVLQSVELGQPVAESQAKLQSAQECVDKARAAADAVVERLRTLEPALDGARAALRIQSDLRGRVVDVARRLRDGLFDSLDIGIAETAALEEEVRSLQEALRSYEALPADARAKVAKDVAQAASIPEFERIVSQVRQGGAVGTAAVRKGAPAPPPAAQRVPRLARERLFQLAAFGVGALTYIFVLVVGWLSVYVESPTFGADPMQYVTLFLWGATVETVRGKTVTLDTLKGLVPKRQAV